MKKRHVALTLLFVCLAFTSNLFGQNDDEDRKQFWELMTKAQSLRAARAHRTRTTTEIFAENAATPKNTIVAVREVAPPDRWRAVTSYEIGGVRKKIELVGVGEKVYVRQDDGRWALQEAGQQGIAAAASTVKFIEKTTFEGQFVRVYEQALSTYSGGDSVARKTRYWFNEDGELLKTESRSVDPKTKETSLVLTRYEYDTSIEIEAPLE